MWAYLFSQMFQSLSILVPGKAGITVFLVLQTAFALVIGWYVWSKTASLAVGEVVNSAKVTFGIFLLTLALIAFPGTLLAPFAFAAFSGNWNYLILMWAAVIGMPIFMALSAIGLIFMLRAAIQHAA
jgi:hypothetical protein